MFKSKLISIRNYCYYLWHKTSYYNKFFIGKSGIEIGGPSDIFKNEIPIYGVIKSLDCLTYSNRTIWEGELNEGASNFNYNGRMGNQIIDEASTCEKIQSEQFDFLLSSHVLEHTANPIKAMLAWKRIVKSGGYILLILPNKSRTFDRYRSYTEFSHLLSDFINGVEENDMTHLSEILENHDFSRDIDAGTTDEFKVRCLDNINLRAMHHHVFNFDTVKRIGEYVGIDLINYREIFPYHMVFLFKMGNKQTKI
jgi:SAM-dependent methyltransferase